MPMQTLVHMRTPSSGLVAPTAATQVDLHKTAEIEEVIHKFEQLTDVVGDGGRVRVELSQVLLIYLANT